MTGRVILRWIGGGGRCGSCAAGCRWISGEEIRRELGRCEKAGPGSSPSPVSAGAAGSRSVDAHSPKTRWPTATLGLFFRPAQRHFTASTRLTISPEGVQSEKKLLHISGSGFEPQTCDLQSSASTLTREGWKSHWLINSSRGFMLTALAMGGTKTEQEGVQVLAWEGSY